MADEKNITQYLTFEEILEKQGYLVYTNVGNSMMPLLRQKKDIIEIRKKEPGRCKKYDVVLYKREDKYILHRILKVLPEGYVIAGDNNTFIDKNVSDKDILGVMTRVIRDGKSIYTTDKMYMAYVHLWCDAYPLRMRALKTKQTVSREIHKVKKLSEEIFS